MVTMQDPLVGTHLLCAINQHVEACSQVRVRIFNSFFFTLNSKGSLGVGVVLLIGFISLCVVQTPIPRLESPQ